MVSHWSIPNVQPPLHSQSPYANQNGNADACYVCGDWLVCQTISVYNNPVTYMYDSNPGSCILCVRRLLLRCNPDGHIGSGGWTTEFRGWTPGRVRLSAEHAFCAFSNTLCGMSHGDQHRPLVSVP